MPKNPPSSQENPQQPKSLDEYIRNYGYSIHERKDNKDPIWEKQGIKLNQRDILVRIIQTDPNNEILTRKYILRNYGEDALP